MSRRHPAKSQIAAVEVAASHVEVLPGEDAPAQALGAVPDHVALVFLEAAEKAADRLNHMLTDDKTWRDIKTSDKRALIELAFLRAYGAPVNRTLSVELTSDDADAVASSLANMHSQLPEQRERVTKPAKRASLPRKATRRQ